MGKAKITFSFSIFIFFLFSLALGFIPFNKIFAGMYWEQTFTITDGSCGCSGSSGRCTQWVIFNTKIKNPSYQIISIQGGTLSSVSWRYDNRDGLVYGAAINVQIKCQVQAQGGYYYGEYSECIPCNCGECLVYDWEYYYYYDRPYYRPGCWYYDYCRPCDCTTYTYTPLPYTLQIKFTGTAPSPDDPFPITGANTKVCTNPVTISGKNVTFSWTVTGNPQNAFWLKVDPGYDSGIVNSGQNSYTISLPPGNYSWKVAVRSSAYGFYYWTGWTCGDESFTVSCGNGICEANENCLNCRADCGQCPPNASFSCDASQCPGGSSENCIMYQPTSEMNPCIFILRNNSTDPDGQISSTKWYIKKQTEPDSAYRLIGNCSGKCDHTIQIGEVSDPGIYTVKLEVQDNEGASSIALKDITVKKEIVAGFMCSLDGQNWKRCEDIKIFQDQIIYLKDDPSLTEHSEPSEGATIVSRTWQKGDGTNFITFAINTNFVTTTLTSNQKIIRLIVRDTNSRADRQDHQVQVKKPLLRWEEMKLKIENFFANLIIKIKKFSFIK